MKKKKLITIVGATASGKTGLGVFLAEKLGGEIVSADSRQVFKGLDIGTGKDLKEYGDIKYHMIDVAEPAERFTLFDYLELARKVIDDIFARGKVPIVIGGTGLYVSALTEGFELKQNKKLNIKYKKYSREELERMPLAELQKTLSSLISHLSSLDTNNPRRLIRAIERAQGGEEMTKSKPDFESLVLAIDIPREELYQRIDGRADERFKAGMLEETQGLLEKGVNPEWLISLGLDYRVMTEYLVSGSGYQASRQSKEYQGMVQKFKYAEHDYARRQLTWWRKRPEVVWISDRNQALKEVGEFLSV